MTDIDALAARLDLNPDGAEAAAALRELSKDAGRYRWLKARPDLRISWYTSGGVMDPVGTLANMDSIIDAAQLAPSGEVQP